MLLLRRARPLTTAAPYVKCFPNSSTRQSQLQLRTFIDAIVNSALGPCPRRKLTQIKTIPFPTETVFKAVSDVSAYPKFLPFTISSTITAQDAAGYPTQAQLKIGYDKFGVEEVWNSNIHCDPNTGIVEAKSGEQASGGLFEELAARWQIGSAYDESHSEATRVELVVNVKFRSQIYDQIFAQVEDKVAASMMSAFEKHIRKLDRENAN